MHQLGRYRDCPRGASWCRAEEEESSRNERCSLKYFLDLLVTILNLGEAFQVGSAFPVQTLFALRRNLEMPDEARAAAGRVALQAHLPTYLIQPIVDTTGAVHARSFFFTERHDLFLCYTALEQNGLVFLALSTLNRHRSCFSELSTSLQGTCCKDA